MNKHFKKLIAAAITLSMLLTALPSVVFADASLDNDLLFYLTFDEENAADASFEASKGGTVTKKALFRLCKVLTRKAERL